MASGCCLQQAAVTAVHLADERFRILAHADIADGGGDEHAFGAIERTQHDFDGKDAAVLAAAFQLDPGVDLLRQRVFGRSQAVGAQALGKTDRYDGGDFLTEQFLAAIAEALLGLQIEDDDFAVLIDHHHGVRGCFEQAAVSPVHLCQQCLGIFPHGDVADGGGDQNAFGTGQWAQHDFDGEDAGILAPAVKLYPGADLLGQGVFRRSQAIGVQPFGKSFRNDIGDTLAKQLVAGVAEALFRLQVQNNDFAALVDDDHGVRRRFEQFAVAAIMFAGPRLSRRMNSASLGLTRGGHR